MFTDASSTGYGAFICEDLNLEVVGSWREFESKYSSSWREMEALNRALKSLGPYLEGYNIRCYTDNRNVTSLGLRKAVSDEVEASGAVTSKLRKLSDSMASHLVHSRNVGGGNDDDDGGGGDNDDEDAAATDDDQDSGGGDDAGGGDDEDDRGGDDDAGGGGGGSGGDNED
ncbi:golgin subfamily A member 6-like protein 2 [Lytechinus pictus]|uniref:golgin subfamily A member 6-like protein 2 n=1 Tax=Lytechinus pictus TaxID=7653 RepID=UPI0030BA2934